MFEAIGVILGDDGDVLWFECRMCGERIDVGAALGTMRVIEWVLAHRVCIRRGYGVKHV